MEHQSDPLLSYLEPYGVNPADDSAPEFLKRAGLHAERGHYSDGLMEYQTVRLLDRDQEAGKGVAPEYDRALLLAIADFIEKHPDRAPGPNPA